MPFSGRTYFIIGIAFAFFFFLLSRVFGEDILRWLVQFQRDARGFGVITTAIVEPFVQMFRNDLFGVIGIVLLWPLFTIWIFLLFMLLLVVFGADAINNVQNELSMLMFMAA